MTTKTWAVLEGYPSWHQALAGHTYAAATTGFTSKEEAEAFAEKLRKHHPNEYYRVAQIPVQKK